MIPLNATLPEADRIGWREEIGRLDVALYVAVAATPTPGLDRYFRRLSRAADHSKLWIGCAAALATTEGRPGRRAGVNGLASIAVTSAVVNLLLKPLFRRRRPDRRPNEVASSRRVAMPVPRRFLPASCFGVRVRQRRGYCATTDWAPTYRHRSPRGLLTGPHGRTLPERHDRRIGHRCGAGPGVVAALGHQRPMRPEAGLSTS